MTDVEALCAADEGIYALARIRRWLSSTTPRVWRQGRISKLEVRQIPIISNDRRFASLTEKLLDFDQLFRSVSTHAPDAQETVLYLGYGSNMSAETFQGRRNIRPISQVNVVVPSLSLTFDLPGIPYSEPCFANVRYRQLGENEQDEPKPPYNKDNWKKGLVGIVYEITKADFAHVIATEGGGASYQDVLVDCYALSNEPKDEVPLVPDGTSFKAHTLFSPAINDRPDHSYAQPSPRYQKLIIDGADEHNLPYEYRNYLENIGTYHITTTKQQLGQFIFLALWAPIFAFIFGGAGLFIDKDGRYPKWYARFAMATFAACWGSYDDFFKTTFGDGERTMDGKQAVNHPQDEKAQLIRYHQCGYDALRS